MRVRRPLHRLLGAATVLGLVLALAACDPPTSIATPVNWDCQIKSTNPLFPTTSKPLAAGYTTTAPQAVAPNGAFTVKVVPQPYVVNSTPLVIGTLTQISDVVVKVAVPANATLTNHTISDWADVGAGTPTSAVNAGVISITIPGPIPAGTTATFPTLTMSLQATGALGSRVEPKLAGTSYASNGLTLKSHVTGTILGPLDPTYACFPSPSPNLHSTLISNDVLAPKITVVSPQANQSILQGSTVLADYSCDDGAGVGVASCVGTVADGAAIDTSSLGPHTFTVTATDNEGKVATRNTAYTVVAPS
jgi:dehydratase